ncbi:sulfite oxidase isoform X3 [Leptinotarsa decemlineata]|uniref:sulfite oxidase isoform X3 n=1 Tax=Leptinotarsa decemlineata TaxID=7539 RepID=UPI003D30C7D8
MQNIAKRFATKLPFYRTSYQALRNINESRQENNHRRSEFKKHFRPENIAYTVLCSYLGYSFFIDEKRNAAYTKAEEYKENATISGKFRENLPLYTAEEIGKHTTMDTRIWVTYKEGVYDITEFIEGHPGGDQILMAAGSSVEPFWLLYGIHKNSHVYDILEKYRIGNLKEEDMKHLTADMSDPYITDPKRHPALNPASLKPFNAECPPSLLVESFITPKNHLPVPDVDPSTYELEVEIEGSNKTITFTLDELKKLPKKTITATVMCAGNRRTEMTKVKQVKGLNWGPAAVGNATWTGVPLREVLKLAKVEDDKKYKHIQFEAVDADVTGKTYGASIPIWKGLDKRGDVLLAYEMNGVPIPRDHGFPIRVIVPGVVGARNVKWLGKIIVSENESDSHWQQNDYKGFSPSTDWDTVDFTKSPAIQELPVISAICKPSEGDIVQVDNGTISVKGYAWSGGGQKIVRVDVTADGGKTWHVAKFDHQDSASSPQHWSWTLWSVKIPVNEDSKTVEIWAKAVDSSYNTQPESFENIWNLRGVLSNAYHRITVNLRH